MPVRSTLKVFIDDVEFPDVEAQGTKNWDFDFATNALVFEPAAAPQPGAQIRVEYTVECL